jgi:hypothetical protein
MSSCPSAASRLPICSRSLTAARLPLLQDEPLSSQLQPCRLVGGSGGQRRHSVTLACLRSVVRFGHAHVLFVTTTKRARGSAAWGQPLHSEVPIVPLDGLGSSIAFAPTVAASSTSRTLNSCFIIGQGSCVARPDQRWYPRRHCSGLTPARPHL